MLQFVTDKKAALSVREQVEVVLEGGCRWIELSPCEDLKEVARELLPLCRDKEAFLVIDDDVDLVEELRVHGVHLSHADRSRAMEVRERLGAHAVIGIDCVTASDAVALKGLDMDYVTFRVEPTPEGVAAFAEIAKAVKDADTGLHIVARGEFPVEMLRDVISAGAAGVAMSDTIISAPSPTDTVSRIISELQACL